MLETGSVPTAPLHRIKGMALGILDKKQVIQKSLKERSFVFTAWPLIVSFLIGTIELLEPQFIKLQRS